MKALLVSTGLVAVLAAAAYGATRKGSGAPAASAGSRSAPAASPVRRPPPRPWITAHPERTAVSSSAIFAFTARGRRLRFQCRLDRGRWRLCRTPVDFVGIAPGEHVFSVRAVDRRGRRGAAARFRWTLLEPKPFSIIPQLSGLGALYPGAPPLPLPLTIGNPNSVPILVTSLRVSVAADPSGCPSAGNLSLGEAGASDASPLEVPAGGSVSLPGAGASPPTIQLRDLPVNQDACQGARFPLEFTGSARG